MENLSSLKDKNPIQILKNWLQLAEEHPHISQAKAMVLSSLEYSTLRVSSRVILLKEIQEENLLFYTNYKSLKVRQMMQLKKVALNFYWPPLGKQIRLEGRVKKTKREKSLQYWKTRSWESQISQYISTQSAKLENRKLLEEKWHLAQKQFYGKEVPCPAHWGGFAFKPNLIEFWMEKPHRLHDRLLFTKKIFLFRKKKWKSHLLYP